MIPFSDEIVSRHAEILANRVAKRFEHFFKRYSKQAIDCFRLYDWDIPEVRAVVDWYGGHLVIAEYERRQTGEHYLPRLAEAVAEKMLLPMGNIHLKSRRTGVGTEEEPRYERLGKLNERMTVRERHLRFFVNLDDFLDTGLYSDHRDTRLLVKDLAKDKDFLNLYAYTGAFTCAAASGGAKTTTTVDRSATYLDWAKDNLELNGLSSETNFFSHGDSQSYLEFAFQNEKRFDLAVVDPPSFFRDRTTGAAFDINVDHPDLLAQVCRVVNPGGTIFFSTNHQRFEPRLYDLPAASVKEITPGTIPEDYRNRQVHRCWKIVLP